MPSAASVRVLDPFTFQWNSETIRFPYPVSDFKLIETHLSVILLANQFAYKIKKPLKYPFVDYSPLDKRRIFCEEEVWLNRRLAADVYLGVIPISEKDGNLEIESNEQVVEYAVKMRRLPEDRQLGRLLAGRLVPDDFWGKLLSRLVFFYAQAARGPEVSQWAEFKKVEEDGNRILAQIRNFPDELLTPELRERLEKSFHQELDRQSIWIQNRMDHAREGHGDLRLEHIYYFPDRPHPNDIAIIDCVEYDPRYRCGDPLSDMAFLLMDLESYGYRREAHQLAQIFLDQNHTSDSDVLSFYSAYHHLERGLARGIQSQEPGRTVEERIQAIDKSRLHFLKGLGKFERPENRPCLVLFSGLPGTGKSSLAQMIAKKEGFCLFSSDETRKELAGIQPGTHPGTEYHQAIYSREWTEKTYAALLEKAKQALTRGKKVLIEASFWEHPQRVQFEVLAHKLGVPFLFFVCRADPQTVQQRLFQTDEFNADIDLRLYQKMAEHWQEMPVGWEFILVNTEQTLFESTQTVLHALAQHHLSRIEEPEEI